MTKHAEAAAAGFLPGYHAFSSGAVTIEVLDQGDGAPVFLLPSLGRGATDFDVLAKLLVDRGHRVLRPQPRGIGASRGPLTGLTMLDLAGDVALAIEGLGLGPTVVAGHAFGNFVARMLATSHPRLVRGVAMLAGSPGMLPSGDSPYEDHILAALARCGDYALSDEARIVALETAFFAPGNDCRVWLDGWYPKVKAAQRAADHATPVVTYFAAGTAPIFEVQAEHDTIAAPRFSHILRQELGPRVTTTVIAGAGHALIPERPIDVADQLSPWVHARYGSGK